MGWRSLLADGVRPLVDLVYPPRCPLCGDAVAEQDGLCVDCFGELEVPGEPSCSSCSLPIAQNDVAVSQQCIACQLYPPRYAAIHAATLYNDASRKLILTLKHGGKIALAPLLGRLMAARLEQCDAPPLLVPVPLHRWRLWGRGFNQAALLAREIERRGKGVLLVDALIRKKKTPSLGGLGSDERRKALKGAIVAKPNRIAVLAGRKVILVDDVLTSGATSTACVNALLDAGAASVEVICFARVVNGGAIRRSPVSQNTTPEAITTPGAT